MDTITKHLIEAKYNMDWGLRDIADTEEEAKSKIETIDKDWPFKVEYRTKKVELPKNDQDRFEYAVQYIEQNEHVTIDDYGSHQTENKFILHIPWGDWKHSHARTDYLMSLFGFALLYENVTEEDGSDTYSAYHYYKSTY